MLRDVQATHALLLQGPVGPFFTRLARELVREGVGVTKVNFNAGDALFYRGPGAVAFRRPAEEWPAFARALIEQRGIDAVFLFGDCRPMHVQAVAIARELGIPVWVFEEGYLRPHFITLEEHGVNGYSRMPRTADGDRVRPRALPRSRGHNPRKPRPHGRRSRYRSRPRPGPQ